MPNETNSAVSLEEDQFDFIKRHGWRARDSSASKLLGWEHDDVQYSPPSAHHKSLRKNNGSLPRPPYTPRLTNWSNQDNQKIPERNKREMHPKPEGEEYLLNIRDHLVDCICVHHY
jgi:hypothetical protein